jgi:hypothetical protein
MALFCGIPAVAQAQTTAPFADVSSRVRAGDTVYVTADGPSPVKGRFVEASASALAILVNGTRQDFRAVDVRRVQRQKRATKWGALIGMAAGGLGLAAEMIAVEERTCGADRGGPHACDDEWGHNTIALVFGGIGAGLGAGIGAGVGSAFKIRETVFARRAGEVSLHPIVDRSRKGLAVSIGF